MITSAMPTVFCADLDRSVPFYTEILGLKLMFRAGAEWASLDGGRGSTIGLHGNVAGDPRVGANGISVGLDVDEPIEQVVARLRERGVDVTDVQDQGYIKIAYFGDPDGNPLYLVEQPAYTPEA